MAKRQIRREAQPDGDMARTIVRSLCGWCATDDHDKCKRETLWYEKHYVCACNCADDFYNSLVTQTDAA